MILQNLAKAIREQNYYAVVLEFLIVIAGVVIGFQIQGWADDRRMLADERAFVDRLYEDIEAVEQQRAGIMRYAERNRTFIASILEKLDAGSNDNVIDSDECEFIYYSNLINYNPAGLPALEELRASGSREFIRSPDLNEAISTFLQIQGERAIVAQEISQGAVDLPSKYPDLIHQRLDLPESGLDPDELAPRTLYESRIMNCNLAGMRTNDAFINDMLDNSQINIIFETAIWGMTAEAITDLKNELDAYRTRLNP